MFVLNDLGFLVCLYVCSLAHFPTDIMLTLEISSSGQTFMLQFSGDIPGMLIWAKLGDL